jgi:hypothetical protein
MMNTSKTDLEKSFKNEKPKAIDKKKKKKNIRELYLDSVNKRTAIDGVLMRAHSIPDLQQLKEKTNVSTYLKHEYGLVKNILSATKALEKLKFSNDSQHQLSSSAQKSRTDINGSNSKYKSPEEYQHELIELKKVD